MADRLGDQPSGVCAAWLGSVSTVAGRSNREKANRDDAKEDADFGKPGARMDSAASSASVHADSYGSKTASNASEDIRRTVLACRESSPGTAITSL
jgi:hypothetical protein